MSSTNPFIRSPFTDDFQVPTSSLPPAPALPMQAPGVPAATAPLASESGKKGFGQQIKSLFTDPKKRTIVIVVAVLVALGIGLFFIHRSFQRRKRRADEDEEAQSQLNAGQQQRPPESGGDPNQPPVVVHPPVGLPPGTSTGFQQPGWDQAVGTSAQQNDRRMQDMQFRAFQQQQQQMGMAPPGQPSPYPLSPGQLPNLNVNPNAGGNSGPGGGGPMPGSPEDHGYDPI